MKGQYDHIEWVDLQETFHLKYGKHYAPINEVLRFSQEHEDDLICICNSDIILNIEREEIKKIEKLMQESIIVLNRVDYKNNFEDGVFYLGGMDVFFIHKKFMKIYPDSQFVLGQCHWDYWVPYRAIKSDIKVTFLNNRFAYHKEHALQYNNKSWIRTGREFMRVEGFSGNMDVGKISEDVFHEIQSTAERIWI